ncbi:MAG: lamin tail domain-containing protein, partial [Akkermansiaceae bacterium]
MKRFSHWLLCLLLILPGLIHGGDSVVVISEIHYHPADNDEEEFIELHNLFSVDVDLSNWSLAGAVDYQFPNGTTIPAGGYLVIARNPSALAAATGHSGAL